MPEAPDEGDETELDLRDAFDRDAFDAVTFTDEELTELALGATPFDPFGPDVERFGS